MSDNTACVTPQALDASYIQGWAISAGIQQAAGTGKSPAVLQAQAKGVVIIYGEGR